MENYALNGYSSLKEINIPNVSEIASYAFRNCTALNTINIDWSKIRVLGAYVFENCTLSFDTLDLANIETIGEQALKGIPIRKLILGKVETLSQNGSLNKTEELVLPNIKTFDYRGLYGNTSLRKVTFSDAVETIPEECFGYKTPIETMNSDIDGVAIVKAKTFGNIIGNTSSFDAAHLFPELLERLFK